MTVDLLLSESGFLPFVRCLQSLPNLHTLRIGRMYDVYTTPLNNALEGVNLPQIKTLNLPPAAHPLLQHCRHVEGLVCAVRDQDASPDGLLGSLTSDQDSQVKRLAIPLVAWDNPSRKWFNTLWNHKVRMMTDCLQPQDLCPRVQGSLNSPSSSLTNIRTKARKWIFCLTRLEGRAPQYLI